MSFLAWTGRLARRTPPRAARACAEACRGNRCAAAVTGASGAFVDPQAPGAICRRAGRTRPAAEVGRQPASGVGVERPQSVVVHLAQRRDGRQSREEQQLALVDVADAGGDALVEQHVDQQRRRRQQFASAGDDAGEVRVCSQQVIAQVCCQRPLAVAAGRQQLHFLGVVAGEHLHHRWRRHGERHAHPPANPRCRASSAKPVPAAVHAEMRAQHRAAIEPQQQVLALGVGRREGLPGQREPLAAGAGVQQRAADEMLAQVRRELVNRIALGHVCKPVPVD